MPTPRTTTQGIRAGLRWARRRILTFLAASAALGALAAPAAPAAAGSWQPPVRLSQAGQTAFGLQLGADAPGNAVAAWYRFDGNDTRVEAALRSATGVWGSAAQLSPPGQGASAPAVAVDNGEALVVWTRPDGNNDRVQASFRSAAGVWSAPVTLSRAGGDAIEPQVAFTTHGDAIALWRGDDTANLRIETSTFDRASATWTPSQFVSPPGVDASEPQLAVDPAGNAVVVWEGSDGANFLTRAALRRPDGSWTASTAISAPGQDVDAPVVAVDAAGSAVATWIRSDGANGRAESASYSAARGAWSAVELLSPAGSDAAGARVALDRTGSAVVAWSRSDGASQRVEARTRPAGQAWQAAEFLSAPGGDAFSPTLAFSPAGALTIAWSRFDGANQRIEVRRGATGALGSVTTLSAAGEHALQPRVVVDGDGDVVALWRRGPNVSQVAEATSLDVPDPAPVQPPATAGGTSPAAAPAASGSRAGSGPAPNLRVLGRKAQQRPNGSVVVRVVCTADSIHNCRGRAELRSAGKLAGRVQSSSGPRLQRVSLGHARYSLEPGERATLVFKLSRKRRALLRSAGVRSVRISAITQVSAGPPSTSARTLKLRYRSGR